MRRQEPQTSQQKPGYLPVPLFNQRKRNRIPLTSAPCENEFFSHREYGASTSSAAPLSTSGTYGPSSTASKSQWNREDPKESAKPQQYGCNRPAPGPCPTMRSHTPTPHPYRAGASSSISKASSTPAQQCVSSSSTSLISKKQSFYSQENSQSKPTPHQGFSQVPRQTPRKPFGNIQQYSQSSRLFPAQEVSPTRSPACHAHAPNKTWKFTNSFEEQKANVVGKTNSNKPQSARPTKTLPDAVPVKPAVENSLRILTTVINGMRHWSQFKDKVPHLFEIFATLDSAVTLGRYGAKNFLMRDGKEVVQCVYYENEQVLPRLIRGQLHRCVGNFERSRNVLVCVSVRPCLPSEQRNAQDAVKVSDAEMRALVKKLAEV